MKQSKFSRFLLLAIFWLILAMKSRGKKFRLLKLPRRNHLVKFEWHVFHLTFFVSKNLLKNIRNCWLIVLLILFVEPPAPVYEAPSIQTQIIDVECSEGEPSHFESIVAPTNDPNLQVLWFRNGQPLAHGSKYAISQDFGYCTLDIGYTYPEDQVSICNKIESHLVQIIEPFISYISFKLSFHF